jgi:DNA-binding NtrC family response regulator
MNAAVTTRVRTLPPGAGRHQVAPGAACDARGELEALKLLILAMWRELSALEAAGEAQRAGAAIDLPHEMRRFESDLIRCALIRTGGRQRRAARLLGMSVATLNAKIKRYRIEADEIINHAAALRLRKQGARDVEE